MKITKSDTGVVAIHMTPEEAAQLHAALQSNINRAWVDLERNGTVRCWDCLGVQGTLTTHLTRAGISAVCETDTPIEKVTGNGS